MRRAVTILLLQQPLSEIMLQQTVVTAAINHFKRWMELFPDVESLAGAEEQSVLKAWEGLGYYSRARNLRKGALYLVENHGGALPEDYKMLLKVPGIGDYTARAVLSLAFSRAYPVLDANVRRIAQRLTAVKNWQSADDTSLMEALDKLIPSDSPGVFNCALMQLGQQVCRVRTPDCDSCPLRESCLSRALGVQGEIPEVKKRKIKEKQSTLCLLVRDGRILMIRRDSGIGKGLWFIPALPGGAENSILASLEAVSVGAESSADFRSVERSIVLKERVHLYTSWREKLDPRLFFLPAAAAADIPSWASADGGLCEWIELSRISEYPTASVYRKILDDIPLLFVPE
ncbi:A/G-specific adenine glycosylase [Oceanispirochaeta sp. M1]|nr:A/G-specific adenine glycosylase [Oceanispirochaeta sp. M1]